MDKIIIRGIVFRKAKSIKKTMEHQPQTEKETKMWYYLLGIYNCRFLGICVYRLKSGHNI
jgi:hypothetical protein